MTLENMTLGEFVGVMQSSIGDDKVYTNVKDESGELMISANLDYLKALGSSGDGRASLTVVSCNPTTKFSRWDNEILPMLDIVVRRS